MRWFGSAVRVAPESVPRTSRIAEIRSPLRMPDAPLTPALAASARSSGSTIAFSEPPDAPSGAASAVGLSDFTVVDDFVCGVSVCGVSVCGVWSEAVMRSVSVTDFLSSLRVFAAGVCGIQLSG